MNDAEKLRLCQDALEAHVHWDQAEQSPYPEAPGMEVTGFHQRMDMCSYAQWATKKALCALTGEPFEDGEWIGVPRLEIQVTA